MVDLVKTLKIVIGMLLRPKATAESYYPESGDWKRTLGLITLPMAISSALVTYLWFASTFGSALGISLGLGSFFSFIVTTAIATGVSVLAFSALAGIFKGTVDFPRGLAAISLAGVPAWAGSLLLFLPVIGPSLFIGLVIYSLFLLLLIVPRYLNVPSGFRLIHFLTSLVACAVLLTVLNPLQPEMFSQAEDELVEELDQIESYRDAAEADDYSPPADGKLTEEQVAAYLDVMAITKDLRLEAEKQVAALQEKASNRDDENPGDRFMQEMPGISTVINFGIAEMKAVKDSGGNWAEHKWIKRQLDSARSDKGRNETTRHNYDLYRRYQDEFRSVKS